MTGWLHDPVWLIVNALAAYRLTRLITRDMLPPLPRLRENLVDRLNKGRASEHPVAYMLGCPWCVGFWVCVLVVVIMSLLPGVWPWLAVPLAFSAVVGHLAAHDE